MVRVPIPAIPGPLPGDTHERRVKGGPEPSPPQAGKLRPTAGPPPAGKLPRLARARIGLIVAVGDGECPEIS